MSASYSYIICHGFLLAESQITEENVITKDVDYLEEKSSTDKVTEAAFFKVMLTLTYDYNFSGRLQIYTDNMSAVNKWKTVRKDLRIASHFENVTVSFIPRELNTVADKIGRTIVTLKVPTEIYTNSR